MDTIIAWFDIPTVLSWVTLALLAFAQNVTFSLVSRSRNRSSVVYHIIAAIGSNVVWFCTFRYLVTADMSWSLLVPYTIGTVSGSVFGVKVSMVIERWLGAESDSHIKRANPLEEKVKALEQRLESLEYPCSREAVEQGESPSLLRFPEIPGNAKPV